MSAPATIAFSRCHTTWMRFFNATNPLVNNSDLRKLIRDPENEHMYYGHVLDMIETTFNTGYMERWTDYWRTLLPRQRFDRHLADMQRRSDFLVGRIENASPRIDFSIATAPTTTNEPQIKP